MAEAILNLLLNKLADAAVNETLRLYGAGGQLDSLQHELRWIQAFLKDAETKQSLDHRARTWVSEVRDVAYRIEDVIDTFTADVDDHKNRQGMINALKQVLRNPKKLPIVRKLTNEMDAIEIRLQKIKEFTERYGINRRESKEDWSSNPISRPFKGVVLPDEDDLDVVGLETDKENIVARLLDLSTPRRLVVSIVGHGGLGKTTLAKKAYNSDKVKREFEIRVWLSISQQFEFINVLSMMLEGIRSLDQDEKDLLKDPKSQPRAIQHFARQLARLLKQKRYLIIMDDVWTSDLWDQVKDVLPDTKNGSRVLLTTRIFDIVRKADSACDPYNMRYLSVEESQELLLKKAFPFQDPKAYLIGLSDLPEKFARKCGNLPLALVIVGGRLSRELPTYNCWYKILQQLNWHDGDGKNCRDILSTSYEDIPAYLKPCFMYFALFPEDYQIKVKPLIQMWVSEGFIPEKNDTTMEETAEAYLEELIQRSMIQVVKRHHNGSIKYCRIHDLLRDLAIEKAKENNFIQIISNQGDKCCSSSTTIRRAALHCDRNDIMQYTGPNIRSLFYFGHDTLNFDSFINLKILYGINNYLDFPSKISKKMTQLRFGNFWDPTADVGPKCWKNINQMRNLETLYFGDTKYHPEADCIWNIKTLRHVIFPYGFLGPPSKINLPNLQTLKSVRVRESWLVEGWRKMPSIRVLRLYDFPQKYKESFCDFLSEAPHLTSLRVSFFRALYEMLDMSSFPSYNHMQSLFVRGKWNNYECIRGVNQYKALDIRLFPIHLIKLTIWKCDFQEDPMPVIENLKNLRKLVLRGGPHCEKQLYCSAGGFSRLEYLKIYQFGCLAEWKVEKGGMPLLKEIFIEECPDLVLIPDLQHMTSLNKLTLCSVHQDLREKLQINESYKIQHIPSIIIY
ncbi:Disease resistance protein RPP8 [Rhynchospora pubera]|uniref:Disease resistance protein RPP8 n=1 Tax=Rhynchospora pubera TaxID=906938 RepID=A0AAV8GU92_9POAL|nr:Disease resistance protein RPP8 [Rhynchospora pubera]